MASPNQFLFDDDGTALINGYAGWAATEEYVNSLGHHSPDAISWSWPEQYGNFGNGGAAMTCAFSNLPKFLDNPANEGSKVTGKVGSHLPPGRMHDDRLVRRTVLWLNLTACVSSQSEHPEAAYLLLQWLGSSRIYSWMTANPDGYFDPFQLASFAIRWCAEPITTNTWAWCESVRRTVPTINYPGATAFHNALDENLVATLKGSKKRRSPWPTPSASGSVSRAAWARTSWWVRSRRTNPPGPIWSIRRRPDAPAPSSPNTVKA